ncbi:MAG: hypothetical protein LUG18_00040 [Candidatus Azobacteroides sp.]|nr:hypothetical protein [Candidatus Azobacteroides sp.]
MSKLKNIYLRITDNPLLGFIPLYVFTISDYFNASSTALLHGYLACFLTIFLVVILGGSGKIHTALFSAVSFITIAVCTVFYLFTGFDVVRRIYHFYSELFIEGIIVITLLLILAVKDKIQIFFINTVKSNVSSSFLSSIDEYFYMTRIILYVFIAHLVVSIAYLTSPLFKMDSIDILILWAFIPVFVVGLIIFEYIRLGIIRKRLNSEEWLAVVNSKGNVIGRIAKSQMKKEGNKYLHPVIRIAVISKGKLYLSERADDLILDPGKTDHPFENYVRYEHSLDNAAMNLLQKHGVQATPYFSVKYLFENDITKRLIFLYTIEVEEDNASPVFNRQNFKGGKFWTQKQIEENLGVGVFAECFEKEYEFLKNTILLFSSFDAMEEESLQTSSVDFH